MCEFEGCGRPVNSRGLCQGHYAQSRKGDELTPLREWKRGGSSGTCLFPGCSQDRRARGYCHGHYRNLYLGSTAKPYEPRADYPTCTFEGCDLPHKSKGLCAPHYRQQLRGKPLRPVRRSQREPGMTKQGYRVLWIPSHPNARSGGLIFEHTVVMSDMIGRPLVKGENVHHKNGVRDDNRPENLELWNTTQPSGQRVEDKVAHALSILALYAPDQLRNESVSAA